MQSKAPTVQRYLAELPPDRRKAIAAVRKVILDNLDPDYTEGMGYGMIGYFVPLSIYPAGYHCNPESGLPYAGLASQKNYMSLYLSGLYCGCTPGEESQGESAAHLRWFHEAWAKTGKKLEMGKSCIRFKKIEDLALDVIGEAIRRIPARKYIEVYERAMQSMGRATDRKPVKKKKTATKSVRGKKSAAGAKSRASRK